MGVVCAGSAYQHVAEALPDASIFKLGCTWPLPARALRDFAASVEALYVVEEASEYLAEQVRALGIDVAAFRPACRLTGSFRPEPCARRSACRRRSTTRRRLACPRGRRRCARAARTAWCSRSWPA